ncbi:PAS domain-containing protein [Cereibacter sp. SYSU M97828]|nr:PAS domain-containing protein [Cereibacter flavus]
MIYLNSLEIRQSFVQDAAIRAMTASNSFDREATSAKALLLGLSQSPALMESDYASYYKQLSQTPAPGGSWFVVWDMRGQVLNTSRPYGADLPTMGQVWGAAKAGLERIRTRGYSISNLIVGPVSKKPAVSVSLRLDDHDGAMAGVLTINLPQAHLDAVVRDPQERVGWTSALLDRGLVPVASNVSGELVLPAFPDGLLNRINGPPSEWTQIYHNPADGRLVSIQHSSVTDYTTLVTVERHVLDAPVLTALRQIAAAGGVLLAALLFAGLFAIRQVSFAEGAAVETVRQMGAAQARYVSLWNDAPEGMFVVAVTANGRFVYEGFNPAHERATGLTFETVVGREPKDFLPRETAAAVTQRYRSCVAARVPTVHAEDLDLPAGRRHMQTHLVPVQDPESHRIVALVGISRDMTEVTAARKDVRDIAARLLSLQAEERQRIASDLHDTTGQHITAAGLALMIVQRMAGDRPGVREAIDDTKAALGEAHREIRTLSYLLFTPEMQTKGLGKTLEHFIGGFASRTGLHARIRITGAVDNLQAELQGMVLRVVQEALVNVHRHAQATHVRTVIRSTPTTLHLYISDDGRGLPRTATETPLLGVGIPGMEARIRQFSGTMRIASSTRGTTIRARIPLNYDGPAVVWSNPASDKDLAMIVRVLPDSQSASERG